MKKRKIAAMRSYLERKIRPFTFTDIFFFICLLTAFVLASLFL